MIRIPHSFKPSKTIDEQLDIFKSRGLIVEDEAWAKEILKRVSYYRFTAYTLSLKANDVSHAGVTFEQIFRLYDFDLKFRLLLMEIIEVVEVSMRTHIALVLADKYDGMGYIASENFDDVSNHAKFIADLDKLLEQSKQGSYWIPRGLVSFIEGIERIAIEFRLARRKGAGKLQ